MNSTESAPKRTRRQNCWYWFAAIAGAGLLVVCLALWNLVTLGRETSALRRELFAALPFPASPQIQISVGPVLLTGARTALAFIHDVPPEVRQALRAVTSASVGVYRLRGKLESSDRVKLLAAADRAMDRRHWSRVVGVNKGHDTVLIYMPEAMTDDGDVQVCLAVCAEDQLVLVSAAGSRDELLELAESSLLAQL